MHHNLVPKRRKRSNVPFPQHFTFDTLVPSDTFNRSDWQNTKDANKKHFPSVLRRLFTSGSKIVQRLQILTNNTPAMSYISHQWLATILAASLIHLKMGSVYSTSSLTFCCRTVQHVQTRATDQWQTLLSSSLFAMKQQCSSPDNTL